VIIITGSVEGSPDTIEEMLRLSVEHVQRSRAEPGCLSHAVHRDVENPLRLVFVERWADMAAVQKHFGVPASGAFVTALAGLATAAPQLDMYTATPLPSG
jgi:quinol monooxygenase YgiN